MARVTTVRLSDDTTHRIVDATIQEWQVDGFIVIRGEDGKQLIVHRTAINFISTENKV